MTESPKFCQEPGCGHDLIPYPTAFEIGLKVQPTELRCPRNEDAHALCAKLAAGEARERGLEEHLFHITSQLDGHPEGYEGPCLCPDCQSYGAEDAEV